MHVAMFERKSDKVRRLVQEGDIKAALRIAKEFRLYVVLGIAPHRRIDDGLQVLSDLYS